MKHPEVDSVLASHEEIIATHGGASGVRSRELLESAIAAPQATFGGEPVISDPVEVAAAYFFYLCSNHPFVDGNKRVALATCLVFLQENELWDITQLDVDAWQALVLGVAVGNLSRQDTTKGLKTLLRNSD